MKKKIYQIMNIVVVFALTFGGYSQARASTGTAPLLSGIAYYVSATAGNDANAGTLTAPFNTISKAMNVAQTGDLIYVRAGTYPTFSISKSGITVAGYNGEMPVISGGKGIECSKKTDVVIKGFDVTGASGNYIGAITLDNCSNVVVEGNKIHDNKATSVSGIVILGSNNKVLNNEIYNNNFAGIRLYGATLNNEIAFNKVYNHTLSAGNSDGIGIADAAVSKTNIHDNTVFGNSDDGIDTWASPGNVIKNNVSYGNGGTGDGNGFKMGGSSTGGNNIVVGNVSYSNETCGFTSNGNGNYYESNASYNNGMCGFGDSWRNAGNTQTSSFINNLAYNNPDGNFKISSTYTTVFLGNSENPAMPTVPTATSTVSPVITATVIPSLTSTLAAPTVAPTLTPMATHTSTLPMATITASPSVPVSPTATQAAPMPTVVVTASLVPVSPTVISSPIPVMPTVTSSPVPVMPTVTSSPVPVMPTVTSSPIPVVPTITLTSEPPVQPTSLPALETIFDDKNGAFVYSAGWEDVSKTRAYNGSYKQTNRKDASVTFNFTGQSFSILHKSGPEFGKMDVYVDGVLLGSVNERTAKSSFQQRWNYTGQLAPGNHTLKLVFAVSKKSNRISGSIDAVIVR